MVAPLGFEIPLWAFIIIGIIVVLLVWKVIKFAITVLIIIIIALIIMFALDVVGAFQGLENLINNIT